MKFLQKTQISLRNSPTTVGSKSMKTDRGTNFPETVSLKNVLNESSSTSAEVSFIWPSAKMPCSRQYNSQQALPICTPAWPMCRDIHSRWKRNQTANKSKTIAKFELEANLIKLLETFRKPFIKHVKHHWFLAKLGAKKPIQHVQALLCT